MNDWLDYKGRGSYRSTIEHAAYHPNTTPIAQQAANSVRGREYDILNAELDRQYSKWQEIITLQKKLNSECVNFINMGRRLRADYVIGKTKISKLYEADDELYRKIINFGGSSMQKTALENKYKSINNKISGQMNSLAKVPEAAISIDSINSMIDEINNEALRLRR